MATLTVTHSHVNSVAQYRQIIKTIFCEYAAIPYAYDNIQQQTVFDEVNDHYLLVNVGWSHDGEDRIYGPLVHLDIIDGKIWVQCDGTADGIADDLVNAGVPKSKIVLGFHPPYKRYIAGFGVDPPGAENEQAGSAQQANSPVQDAKQAGWIDMTPGVRRRTLASGETMMQMLVDLKAGSHLALHDHPNEQLLHVVQGRLRLTVEGEPHEVGPGESFYLHSSVPHAVDALEDTLVVDTFSPPREDLLAQDRAAQQANS